MVSFNFLFLVWLNLFFFNCLFLCFLYNYYNLLIMNHIYIYLLILLFILIFFCSIVSLKNNVFIFGLFVLFFFVISFFWSVFFYNYMYINTDFFFLNSLCDFFFYK